MLLLTMGSNLDPHAFIHVDEDKWTVTDRTPGPYVIGGCRVDGYLYYFKEGEHLWRVPINETGVVVPEHDEDMHVQAPGAHSIIAMDDGTKLAFTVSDENQVWIYSVPENKVVDKCSPTLQYGSDYSHFNGLCRDPEGWWYISMIAWHRTDRVRWRDRERIGVIARFEDPFHLQQADIVRCDLRAPHSVMWDNQYGLCFCNSNTSEVFIGDSVSVRLDIPFFVRGLLVDPPLVWFGGSTRGVLEGTPESSRLYEYNINTQALRFIELGSPDEPAKDIYDIVRTAPGTGRDTHATDGDIQRLDAVIERLTADIAAQAALLAERDSTIIRLQGDIATATNERDDTAMRMLRRPVAVSRVTGKHPSQTEIRVIVQGESSNE